MSLVMRIMVSSLLGDEYDDDGVEVRVPSLWHGLDFDIGALGEDSLAGNSDTLFAYLDNVYSRTLTCSFHIWTSTF